MDQGWVEEYALIARCVSQCSNITTVLESSKAGVSTDRTVMNKRQCFFYQNLKRIDNVDDLRLKNLLDRN